MSGPSGTHVWYDNTATPLELRFDFLTEYDLTTLRFWNYFTESFDVDEINFKFYSAAKTLVGTLQFFPNLVGCLVNSVTLSRLTSVIGKARERRTSRC